MGQRTSRNHNQINKVRKPLARVGLSPLLTGYVTLYAYPIAAEFSFSEEGPVVVSDIIYQCRDLGFEYLLGKEKVAALRGLSVDINRGDFVCVSGPSGSGKSTFLNLLGLIEPVQTGSLTMGDVDLGRISEREKNKIRRYKLGFIFQSFNLMDVLRADENVEYFLARQGLPLAEREARVEEALTSVGLWEHRHKRPLEMSGGQRQRVAIARAIAKKPEVIIADEPTANLDQGTGGQVVDLLLKLTREQKVTVIISSHDPVVRDRAPREIKLIDGRLVADGKGR